MVNAAQAMETLDTPQNHHVFPLNILLFFSVLFIYVFAGSAFEHYHVIFHSENEKFNILNANTLTSTQLHYLHESGLAIMLGGLLGLSYHIYNQLSGTEVIKPISFNEEIFFYFMLPPIIFSSGYNLRTRKFFAYFRYTLLFGIMGTILNFFVTFGLTYLIFQLNEVWILGTFRILLKVPKMREILLFSATICSTDTVAVITLIKDKDHPKLFNVIFGEGLANDATAIILYQAVSQITQDGSVFKVTTPIDVILSFCSLASLSILVGIIFGIMSALYMKRSKFMNENPSAQLIGVLGFGYLSYILSEICDLSGIITILFTGIVMSHYTFYNLSQSAQISTGATFAGFSLLAEGFIFIYIGISAFYYASEEWSLTLILIEIPIIFIARFVGIFILASITKGLKLISNWELSNRELAVIWFGGLIRGAIALGLIFKSPVSSYLRSTVLALVLITTVVLGALMPKFIRLMVKTGPVKDKVRGDSKKDTLKLLEEQIYNYENRQYKNKLHFHWRLFDDTFMKPWLIRNYNPESHKLERRLKYHRFSSARIHLGNVIDGVDKSLLSEPLIRNDHLGDSFGDNTSSLRMSDCSGLQRISLIKPNQNPPEDTYLPPKSGLSFNRSNSFSKKEDGQSPFPFPFKKIDPKEFRIRSLELSSESHEEKEDENHEK